MSYPGANVCASGATNRLATEIFNKQNSQQTNQSTVWWLIKCFKETGRVTGSTQSGRLKNVTDWERLASVSAYLVNSPRKTNGEG